MRVGAIVLTGLVLAIAAGGFFGAKSAAHFDGSLFSFGAAATTTTVPLTPKGRAEVYALRHDIPAPFVSVHGRTFPKNNTWAKCYRANLQWHCIIGRFRDQRTFKTALTRGGGGHITPAAYSTPAH